MIRHRPFGLGHPYRTDPDQRIPAQPVAGEPIELRATTDRAESSLSVELVIDGHASRQSMAVFDPASGSGGTGGGHLASAARRLVGRGRKAWHLHLDPAPAGSRLRYRFTGASGDRTRWHDVTVAGWVAERGSLVVDDRADGDFPAVHSPRVVADSISWLQADAGPSRMRFALRLEPGAHVIGFGERFDRIDQHGRALDATVFEQYKGQGQRTYLPVPFAIVVPVDGGAGWGFHVRTTRRTWYDVGATDPARLAIEVDLNPDDSHPTVEVAIYHGSPAEVLAAFLAEIGRPALPPDWVFRPWMSGNEWNTDARVRAEVERSLQEGIPVGVLVIEAWSDESTFTAFRDARYEVHPDGAPHRLPDFTFPPDGAWPDPKGLVDWLHARGVRLLLWQIPLQKARPAPVGQARADRDTMVARGYAVRDGAGQPYRNRGWWFPGSLMPDWTNPAGRDWWLAKRRYLVDDVGIDGFKTDGGEHAWGHDLRYADGTRGSESNNRYPVQYAAAYHDLLRSAGREPVTFSRAGFTGAGAVPCHWAGDEDSTWEAFRASVAAGVTAGASGVFFWGWDLGGFSGEIPDAELYLRSAAMACFCPLMQYHSEFNHHRAPSRDRTPWNIAERTGDERVLPAYRAFARLRERLVPYLAAEARRSVETSVPLMRALCFDWPADPRIWEAPFQYALGESLLVAPVVEPGVAEWDVYLPDGEWRDAWTGEALRGSQVVRRAVPLDRIPVFVREPDWPSLRDIFQADSQSG